MQLVRISLPVLLLLAACQDDAPIYRMVPAPPAEPVQVVIDPDRLPIEVTVQAPPPPEVPAPEVPPPLTPTREFVGFAQEQTALQSLEAFHGVCWDTYPGARMCTDAELVRSTRIPRPAQTAWVARTVVAMAFAPDGKLWITRGDGRVGPRVVWPEWQKECDVSLSLVRPLPARGPEYFEIRDEYPCGEVKFPVACCAYVPVKFARN